MSTSRTSAQTGEPTATLGERVRRLRMERGLTQSDLAGERFTKEYLSQIERGKTRPTAQTIDWLAARLAVDHRLLETGVSEADYARGEAIVTRAEAAVESGLWDDATASLDGFWTPSPELAFRALLVEAWARFSRGEARDAIGLLGRADALADDHVRFTDVDRAEVLYRLGCCRYKLSSISTAIALFGEALALAERSGLPCDRLRAHAFEWRSRCYRRQRDWEAAREDIERALELAEGLDDRAAIASTYFQASLVAERQGQWILSRSYAERAKAVYEEIADRQNVGRLLNNLGGLTFLLGRPDEAIDHLKQAFATALEVGSDVDAGYAISSLAQIHLRTGRHELAEEQARKALELLGGREDLLDEIGNAQLVLGRSLLEQGRLDEAEAAFGLADTSFQGLSSESHRAATWIAQGDLAARRGDDRSAARLYRRAAEALQDFRF